MLYFVPWGYILHSMLAEMNVPDIYVGNTRYLFQMIFACNYRENSQHSMSDNPYYNNISI